MPIENGMSVVFTHDEVIHAHSEIHDAAGRLFGWNNDQPEALRMAKRIAGCARILVIGIEERQGASDLDPRKKEDRCLAIARQLFAAAGHLRAAMDCIPDIRPDVREDIDSARAKLHAAACRRLDDALKSELNHAEITWIGVAVRRRISDEGRQIVTSSAPRPPTENE